MTRRPKNPICKFNGCDRPTYARGMCSFHYHRWLYRAEPGETDPKPVIERIRKIGFTYHVVIPRFGECWDWNGAVGGHNKIPTIRDEDNRATAVPRVLWRVSNGAIPAGAEVWRRCRNPLCIRPAHLYLHTPHHHGRTTR